MARIISEWKTPDNKGKAIVSYSGSDEIFMIDYYDNNGKHFYVEDFPNITISTVEGLAESWTLGTRKLEDAI